MKADKEIRWLLRELNSVLESIQEDVTTAFNKLAQLEAKLEAEG